MVTDVNDSSAGRSVGRVKIRTPDLMLRGMLAVNFALFVLTFIPAFSGIGPGSEPGLADRLWGRVRLDGWRVDVVWVCLSTAAVCVGGLRSAQTPGPRATTTILCRVWLVCFGFYFNYIFVHMLG
jgi:hypothetical protein